MKSGLRHHHIGIPTTILREGEEVLIEPNTPAPGVTVAFIVHNGAPVEFLQFDDPGLEAWPGRASYSG